MIMESPQLHDFAQRYTAAWCSQDPARVASFFSPNGSLRVNDSSPAVGRTAISQIARSFMSAFPDLHLTMGDFLIQEDHSVFHWTLDGTHAGPGGTGHRVHISGFEVWEFGPDDLIAESRGHFDNAAYQQQLQHGFSASP
jgi:predicted ester cyclase